MRREVLARLVQHVGGHLHRGQRRPQLVGDVGGEPLLQLGEPLELGDLPLEAVGHRVEAGGQPGELVLAAHGHPFLELPLGQPLGGAGRPPHRVDDQPGDQHADADDEQGQRHADDHRPCRGSARGSPPPGPAGRRSTARSARRRPRRWAPGRRRAASAGDSPGVRDQRVLVRLAAVGDVGAQVGGQRVGDVRAADGGRLARPRSGRP